MPIPTYVLTDQRHRRSVQVRGGGEERRCIKRYSRVMVGSRGGVGRRNRVVEEGLWRWVSGFGVRRGLYLPRPWSLVWPYVTEARLASEHDQASILADATQVSSTSRAASLATARPRRRSRFPWSQVSAARLRRLPRWLRPPIQHLRTLPPPAMTQCASGASARRRVASSTAPRPPSPRTPPAGAPPAPPLPPPQKDLLLILTK